VRTSLGSGLPAIVADGKAVRQIALNLMSNALRFTRPGGQIIVSTARTERGETVLRVRDTGIGMSADELEAAMQPFRHIASTSRNAGAGVILPIAKALAEANRGVLTIASGRQDGTLVEVSFPPGPIDA
jgi:signal transduction histidine kinase